MVKTRGGTDKSQSWLTFLHNHLEVSWAMDFFTVPTVRFQILYIFVILNHSRRQVVQFAVTLHPSGRLIFCSTKRLQKVRTHRDHHWSQQ